MRKRDWRRRQLHRAITQTDMSYDEIAREVGLKNGRVVAVLRVRYDIPARRPRGRYDRARALELRRQGFTWGEVAQATGYASRNSAEEAVRKLRKEKEKEV